MKKFSFLAIVLMAALAVTGCNQQATKKSDSGFGPKHKVVIQVSTRDPLTQKIALNNAVNLQKHYGPDNVKVEIVAYGPGLSLLTKKSKNSLRVQSLALSDIRFSACNNTMKKIKRKKGKMPKLTSGVKIVSAGVARIMELQEKGYSYVRP
jgi:intracellular sulfur oxidation DsrE/DsrF family protein